MLVTPVVKKKTPKSSKSQYLDLPVFGGWKE